MAETRMPRARSKREIYVLMVAASGLAMLFASESLGEVARLKTNICFQGQISRCYQLTNETHKRSKFDTVGLVEKNIVVIQNEIPPTQSENILRSLDNFRRKHRKNIVLDCPDVVLIDTHENEVLTNAQKYCVGPTHSRSLGEILQVSIEPKPVSESKKNTVPARQTKSRRTAKQRKGCSA